MYVCVHVHICVCALRDTKSLVRLARMGLTCRISERREFENKGD